MRRLLYISLASILFLFASSIVLALLPSAENYWLVFGIGVGIICGGLAFVFVAKKLENPYLFLIPIIANAIGLAFCIKTWYIYRGIDNPLWVLLLVSLASVSLLWIFYLFLNIKVINNHYKIYLVIFIILCMSGYIPLVIFTETTYVSTFGFYLIIEAGFLFALSVDHKGIYDFYKGITYSTYTVFIVAIIILILIISGDSGGDIGIDVADGLLDGLTSPKKKRPSDSFMT